MVWASTTATSGALEVLVKFSKLIGQNFFLNIYIYVKFLEGNVRKSFQEYEA